MKVTEHHPAGRTRYMVETISPSFSWHVAVIAPDGEIVAANLDSDIAWIVCRALNAEAERLKKEAVK